MRLTDLLNRPNDSRISTAEYERLKREHGGCLHVVHVNEGENADVPEVIRKLRAYEEANDIEGPPYLLVVEYAEPPEDEAPAARLTVPVVQPVKPLESPDHRPAYPLDGDGERVPEKPHDAREEPEQAVLYKGAWYPSLEAKNRAVERNADPSREALDEAFAALRKTVYILNDGDA